MSTNSLLPTDEERKQWWTFVYAHSSFENCRDICTQMLKTVYGTRHFLYIPFAVTIHAFYCRPFMKHQGATQLTRKYVPKNFLGLHDALMTFRNKVFSHSDSNTVKELPRPLNELVYTVTDSNIDSDYFIVEPRPDLDYYKSVLDLLPILIDKTFCDLYYLHNKYLSLLPKSTGEYVFKIKGDTLFDEYTEPDSHIHFKGLED